MKRKTLLTLVLSLLLVVGVVGGTFAMSPKAVAQESNPEWLSSFTMLAGAEVRTADPNGIRFTTEISASEYNALMAKVELGEYASVEFGTLICPVEYAENGAIKDESNEHVTKLVRKTWDVEYNPTLQTEVYQYNGDLMGLTTADLVREYQALGYCTITTAEGDVVTYYASVKSEGDNVRSPLYVAAYNVSVFGSESEYLLAMIDSAMAGKTLTLSQTSASLTWKQVIDFPIVATVDGLEVSVIYYVEDESIASYENGKLTAVNAGSTNIVAVLSGAENIYSAKIPVTVSVDTSSFEGLEAKSISEAGGSRSASSALYYEKGVGLWFMIEANHNAFTKGWGGSGLDLDVTINGKEYWLYYGTGGVGAVSTGADGVGFDLSKSTIVVTKNAEGSATAYSTLMVALISEQTLLADGASEEAISEGTVTIDWLAIKSPGEDSITGTGSGMWLIHGEAHVCEEGYFIPQKPIDLTKFEGLEAKTATAQDGEITLSATMVYEKGVGLWVKAEATHNNFTKGWGGSGVNLEVAIGSGVHFIYYGTGGVGFIGFDEDASDMRVTENAEGAKYSTLVVGLLTDATLLSSGITQAQLDSETIPVVHAAFGSPNEGWWYIHKDAYVGGEGYFVPQKPLDVSKFEGLEAKTVAEQNGSRSLSATMVYEKGVGLWVKVEANHNEFTKGWGGSGLDLEVWIGNQSLFIYYGTGGVGVIGFDATESDMRVTENAEGAKYSTLVVGLITNAKLLECGVTQAQLDSASIFVSYAAFKSPGEGNFTTTAGTSAGNDQGWWYIHKDAYVGENGYFVPEEPIDVSRFEGLETKAIAEQDGTRKVTTTLVYEKGVGLWVKAEAQHNVLTKGSWAGNSLNIEVAIGSQTYWLYYAESGLGTTSVANANGGFNLEESAIKVTENAEGATYTTLMVGLISEATLLADGAVSQETINEGYLVTAWFIFKSVGEGSFTTTNGTTTNSDNWVIFGEAYVGEEGFFVPTPVEPEPDPEPEITVDLTRFEGLEAKTVAEQDGVRTLSSVMVYEKGVGLWVKVDANHNVFTKGWGGSGLDLELNIGGVLYWLYFDEEGPGSLSSTANGAGFDMENTNFVVTENETGAKYTTLIAGLIPEATLTADGIDVSKGYISVIAAFKSPSEGSFTMTNGSTTPTDYWYIHGAEYVTAEGYKDEDYILVSRFVGKNSVSTQDLTGKYSFTQYAYYEKGVGVWMYGIAVHSTLNWNTAFGPYIGTNMVQFYIHNGGSNLLADTTKSFDQVTIWTEQNADGSYTTSFVGLAKESDIGTKLTDDIIPITPVFENGGAMQVHVQAGAGTSWWQMPTELVDANGFFDGGVSKSVQFTDANTNKMFSYSAKLNQYGLYLEAEAKSDASANALLMIEYSTNYWSPSNAGTTQIYLGANAGSEPTWKSVRALTATDSAAFGFTTHTYYKAFYDWTFLKNLGIMSLNQDSLVDSTLYISILFMSDNSAADSMEFTRKNNLNATESVKTYNWGFHTCWTPIDSTTVNYIRHHVTKNGIAN